MLKTIHYLKKLISKLTLIFFQSLSNRFQMYQHMYELIQPKNFQSIQSQINQQQIFQMQ